MLKEIEKDFFIKPTLEVCKNLIGCIIETNLNNVKIVAQISEIEGYLGINDKACHTYKNRCTERTKIMYLTGGYLYVYFSYGLHYNLNFVTEPEGVPCAILLRGINVLEGQDEISRNRYNKSFNELNIYQRNNITNGPGKVCKALNINKKDNAKYYPELFKIYYPESPVNYICLPRIGIDYAGEDKFLPYRFLLK